MPLDKSNVTPFCDPISGLTRKINPYLDKLVFAKDSNSLPIMYGKDLQQMPGHWHEKFSEMSEKNNSLREIFLEIGCYKGETLVSMAEQNIESGFIGVDLTFKRVFLSGSRAAKKNLKNIICVLFNGKFIGQIFAESELSGIIIFFPDPWDKKKRQEKNRLISEDFVVSVHKVLKPGGFIWFKTDKESYYNEAKKMFLSKYFRDMENKDGLCAKNYPTTFQTCFLMQKAQIYEGVWHKYK